MSGHSHWATTHRQKGVNDAKRAAVFTKYGRLITIAARCGTALVIARKDASRVGMLQELVGSFSGSPAKLAGVVMNEF